MVARRPRKYPDLEYTNQRIKLDTQGFLIHPEQWDDNIAVLLAAQDQLILSASHWQVILFFRDYHKRHGFIPIMRVLGKAMAKQFSEDKANSLYLYTLFPLGPIRQASRIGGLPKPISCI